MQIVTVTIDQKPGFVNKYWSSLTHSHSHTHTHIHFLSILSLSLSLCSFWKKKKKYIFLNVIFFWKN